MADIDQSDPTDSVGLEWFNGLSSQQVLSVLHEVCSAAAWAEAIDDGRPFADTEAVLDASDDALASLTEADVDTALAGHPRIGERAHNASSQAEQSGVTGAGRDVLDELARANADYEDRFGHVYLVFANGRPADELLQILRSRLSNDPATERAVIRTELAKINRRRLVGLLGTGPAPSPSPSEESQA
ncbi:2-oxo-4-hydroxy-4-carboxy-5-ureidoimidazoline decarboxylase [Gordonia jinhuaensis]|uniref:2-oxo-4-hydroxy-4-carboxy-5-ureidoimidazoline decarboxylase n=1 Tax=Gordonia jinhuaensis TaxID=1517702 RepID=A0A916STC5_9ACTN|nr:hypothetical protein GCM10011489_00990 [Gordonia jinhuaensis]